MSNSNTDIHWVEFKLVDVFDVVNTKSILKEQIVPGSGSIPYVTAGESNNAVTTYIDCPEEWIDKGGCVLIGGKTMVVTYQKDDFCSNDSHNLALYLKDKNVVPDEKVFLFLVTVIKKALGKKYAWGDSISFKKIQKDVIQLPVDSTGKIALDYMQECIAEMEQERIAELEEYLVATGLNDYELTEADKQVLAKMSTGGGNSDSAGCNESTVGLQWKEFRLGDLFEKLPVRKANKKDVQNFKNNQYCVPVVYAKFGDNGIMYWGLKDKFTTYSNVISIVYNGVISAGRVYAQEESTGILAESYFIRLKDGNVSFLVNQFLACVIEKAIYSHYSRENLAVWNERVENDIISLPAKEDGTPDYNFMERYIRAIEKVTIANTMKWKDKVIETTKNVV